MTRKVMPDGRYGLFFPAVFMSDMHLGTFGTRAKRLCLFLDLIETDRLYLVGDIVGGTEMEAKRKFQFGGSWHKQVLGHFLRKARCGTEVTYIPGNHDAVPRGREIGRGIWHRKLTGKSLVGVRFVEHDLYTDPNGRRFKVLHGDEFDDMVGFWYKVGDWFIETLQSFDHFLHSYFPRMREHSVAAVVKRAFKGAISTLMDVKKKIRDYADHEHVDGIIYGHSHIGGFQRTAGGKIAMNDGCCTEHVQALVHDEDGTWALLTMFKDRFLVTEEDGTSYPVFWRELGLEESMVFGPTKYQDQSRKDACRVLSIIERAWPSKERVQSLEARRKARVRKVRMFVESKEICDLCDFQGAYA
ncbi:MAG TPA: UDP-2,3-diacylglucosamine diphosphatase [Alphaproteobacteria bacterium]|nr:UDP-2,3-diacylglucosamine diphosphatase [Alphaproteobacteria bacterium]HNS43933.1 UDP-2,3-diacylglucosamine diphosphatase [Alphaproteobacteria bacterium]